MASLRKTALVGALTLPFVVGGFMLQERSTRDGARVFDQVLSLVAGRFVDTVDAGALYEKAAKGLVEQLNDPYSELMPPKQATRSRWMSCASHRSSPLSRLRMRSPVSDPCRVPYTSHFPSGEMAGRNPDPYRLVIRVELPRSRS